MSIKYISYKKVKGSFPTSIKLMLYNNIYRESNGIITDNSILIHDNLVKMTKHDY